MGVNRNFNPGVDQLARLLTAQNASPSFLLGGLVGSYLKDKFHDSISGLFAQGDKDGGATKGDKDTPIEMGSPMTENEPQGLVVPQRMGQDLAPTPNGMAMGNEQENMSLASLGSKPSNSNNNQTINTQGDILTQRLEEQPPLNQPQAQQQPMQQPQQAPQMMLPKTNASDVANGMAQLGQKQMAEMAASGGQIEQMRNATMQQSMQAAQQMMAQQQQEDAQKRAMVVKLAKMYAGGFNEASDTKDNVSGAVNSKKNTLEQALVNVQNQYKYSLEQAKANNDSQGIKEAETKLKALDGIANGGFEIPFIGEDSGNKKLTDNELMLQAMKILKSNKAMYAKAKMAAEQGEDEATKANAREWLNNSHIQAEAMREVAKNAGLNSKAFSPEATEEQLDIAIANKERQVAQEQAKAKAEERKKLTTDKLLEEPRIDVSPQEFYSRKYEELRKKGYPEWIARQRAASSADMYQGQYESLAITNIANQGINPDGSINNLGVEAIARLANAGAVAPAQLYNNDYATPLRQWGLNADLKKNEIAQAYQQERLNQQMVNNIRIAQLKGQIQSALAQQRFQQQAALKQIPQVVVNRGGGGGGSTSHGGSTGGGRRGATSQADKEMNNTLKDIKKVYDQAQKALEDGDNEESGVLIRQLQNMYEANKDDFDKGAQQDFYDAILALNVKREENAGYTDTAQKYLNSMSERGRKTYLGK